MMEAQRPRIGGTSRERLWSQRLQEFMQKLSHEIVKELGRLNSARLGKAELSRLAPSDRARAVKEALAAHHAGNARCC